MMEILKKKYTNCTLYNDFYLTIKKDFICFSQQCKIRSQENYFDDLNLDQFIGTIKNTVNQAKSNIKILNWHKVAELSLYFDPPFRSERGRHHYDEEARWWRNRIKP